MKITVCGVGYVGLVTGTCLAEMGNDVVCMDLDEAKVRSLRLGKSPIYEPGLDDLLTSNIKAGRMTFTTNAEEAVRAANIIFIAVGTPSDVDGSADLRYVLSVAKTIGTHMQDHKVVITKSTVPVGTAGKVQKEIAAALKARGSSLEFDVVSNPEFLKEGAAIEDCLKPARIVVGCETDRAKKMMADLYAPFVKNGHPIHFMDTLSSEMTKYAANAMLATKISFMNELSRLCEKVGADIEKIRVGIGSDPRIGHHFIYPGLGYGGSCFPKDVKALVKTGSEFGEELTILQAVEDVNATQKLRFTQRVRDHFKGSFKGKKVGVWGLAFKPGTDDLREAPALELIEAILKDGGSVQVHDPVAMEHGKKLFEGNSKVVFAENPYDALDGSDALCIVTEWKPFREPDFARMKKLLKDPVIFDGRNLYEPARIAEAGISYYSIGRLKK